MLHKGEQLPLEMPVGHFKEAVAILSKVGRGISGHSSALLNSINALF